MCARKEEKERCQEPFPPIRGRPRGRNDDSNPSRLAVSFIQCALPKGAPRLGRKKMSLLPMNREIPVRFSEGAGRAVPLRYATVISTRVERVGPPVLALIAIATLRGMHQWPTWLFVDSTVRS